MIRLLACALLLVFLPTVGGMALAADLDDGSTVLVTPSEPVPVVEPLPVPVGVAVPVPVAVPVFVPVVPLFGPFPPPPLPSPTLFSAPVGYLPPPPPIPTARAPDRAEAEYYGYGRRGPPPRPLGFYSPDGRD